MTNIKPLEQIAHQYEYSIIVMVNAFINWYYEDTDFGYTETLQETLDRFVSSDPDFNTFELSDMLLSPHDVYLCIRHKFTQEEFHDWYWSYEIKDGKFYRAINIQNWKYRDQIKQK